MTPMRKGTWVGTRNGEGLAKGEVSGGTQLGGRCRVKDLTLSSGREDAGTRSDGEVFGFR